MEFNPIRRFVFQCRIIQQCWLNEIRTRLNQTGQITHGRAQRNQHRVDSRFIDLETGIQPHVPIDRAVIHLNRENIFSLHQKIRGILQNKILSPCRQATSAVSKLIMIDMRLIRSHVCPRDFHPIDPGDKSVVKVDRQNHRTIRPRFQSRGIERFSDIKRRRDIVQLRTEICRERIDRIAHWQGAGVPVRIIKRRTPPGRPRAGIGLIIFIPTKISINGGGDKFINDDVA